MQIFLKQCLMTLWWMLTWAITLFTNTSNPIHWNHPPSTHLALIHVREVAEVFVPKHPGSQWASQHAAGKQLVTPLGEEEEKQLDGAGGEESGSPSVPFSITNHRLNRDECRAFPLSKMPNCLLEQGLTQSLSCLDWAHTWDHPPQPPWRLGL